MTTKAVKYSKGEIGKVRVVKDFLPSPDQLVPASAKRNATLQYDSDYRTAPWVSGGLSLRKQPTTN